MDEEKKEDGSQYENYVIAHKTQLQAAKRKRPLKQEILEDMYQRQKSIVSENGKDFFILKPGKVMKHPLNAEFIQRGYVAYLLSKGMPVTDMDGKEFMQFLEARRDSYAVAKETTVRYQDKRPPSAYFT